MTYIEILLTVYVAISVFGIISGQSFHHAHLKLRKVEIERDRKVEQANAAILEWEQAYSRLKREYDQVKK